jgi:molecular chaperone DnaK
LQVIKVWETLDLDGIPSAERGVPQIEVTFDIDVDGILSVKAKEKETGVEQSVTIQGASNLNENEVETMLADAEKFAAADKEKRENIDLKNQAETLCFEAEKEIDILKNTISIDEKEKITELIKKIQDEIQTENLTSLKLSVDNLKEAMRKIVTAKVDNESNSNSVNDLNDL